MMEEHGKGFKESVDAISISRDGQWFIASSGDNIKLWEFTSGRCARIIDVPAVSAIAFLPTVHPCNIRWVWRDKTLKIWDLKTEDSCIRTIQGHNEEISVISIDRSGRWALTGGRSEASIYLWDLKKGKTCQKVR